MNFETFSEGYKSALTGVEKKIDESINRNHGALTPQQVVNVLNDTIIYLHQELQSVAGIEEKNEEEPIVEFAFSKVESVVNDVLAQIKETMGGMK